MMRQFGVAVLGLLLAVESGSGTVAGGQRIHRRNGQRLVRRRAAGRDRHAHQHGQWHGARWSSPTPTDCSVRLLLPLGRYRVVAELPGFKRFEQTNISLSVGETVVVNATLSVGAVNETITVSANVPALNTARIDIGHTMSDLEVHNLPLVARNPYNFALVQPGVTGYENQEFGVPRLAANGAAMRINYQIDGNTNTEKDRAGLRLLPMSEVMIQEVKVVTTGFAPEFGQAMGMVYNAVTPSGTNSYRGEGSYLFRRNPFSAFPFFFGCGSTTPAANCPPVADDATRPATKVDTGTAAVGGPIVKNKLFFYGGWERTRARSFVSQLDYRVPGSCRAARTAAAAGGRAERVRRRSS